MLEIAESNNACATLHRQGRRGNVLKTDLIANQDILLTVMQVSENKLPSKFFIADAMVSRDDATGL